MDKLLNKDNSDRLQIVELFMAKADPKRCFFGIIKRWEDDKGTPYVASKIVMPNDGYIVAQEHNQRILGTMLDEICVMVLDCGIHDNSGVSYEIFGIDFFLN
jgi:hypothetical protein